jgi:hypothetical protein
MQHIPSKELCGLHLKQTIAGMGVESIVDTYWLRNSDNGKMLKRSYTFRWLLENWSWRWCLIAGFNISGIGPLRYTAVHFVKPSYLCLCLCVCVCARARVHDLHYVTAVRHKCHSSSFCKLYSGLYASISLHKCRSALSRHGSDAVLQLCAEGASDKSYRQSRIFTSWYTVLISNWYFLKAGSWSRWE